ncbi:MAG: phosphotransferase, partial [Prevotella sp.]|nr:phosphotransferase [Prevotella sp.]
MQKLIELYRQWSGAEPHTVAKLPGAGSNREYYRMADAQGQTVVGCIGTSRDENHAFVYLARHFGQCQLPVPTILAVSDDELRYLQTDLGSTSLFDAIRGGREAGGRYTLKEQQLLRRTIRQLPNIQINGARGLDFANCYPQPAFDTDSVLFDLNYFKYCFLKATELDFHELKLEADFRLLAADLTAADDTQGFLYRDFQARNVMLDAQGNPYFIDFQGGRRGPFYYDLASFLWQASAKYPHKVRRELVYEYYNALKQYTEVPAPHSFVERLSLFVLFRQLQVLGAYGFRGYFERKAHFIESIPPAMQNLRELLSERNFPYPYLTELLARLTELPRFRQVATTATRADGYRTTDNNPYKPHPQDGPATFSKYDAQGPLVVRVFSFSFTKGIPEDE